MKKHRWLQNVNPDEILKQDFNEERVGIWVENFKENMLAYMWNCIPPSFPKKRRGKNLCFPPK